MALVELTAAGNDERRVWVNPAMVLDVTAYNDKSTTIHMAAGKGDGIHTVFVKEPPEHVVSALNMAS